MASYQVGTKSKTSKQVEITGILDHINSGSILVPTCENAEALPCGIPPWDSLQ